MKQRSKRSLARPFSELARALDVTDLTGPDPLVTSIRADSRRVAPGDLFVAIRGFEQDGHKFIPDAIAAGAGAIIFEDKAFRPRDARGVAALRVPNSRRAAAILADEFFQHPSRDITLLGVTGTNGKTTVTLMLDSILRAAGADTGVIGTLGRRIRDAWHSADRTTPDAVELQGLLADMRDQGTTHAAMEVSSHALALDRVYGCRFAGAVFTNLSRDHLDFHSGLDEYLDAKLKLFTTYADLADPDRPMVGAINVDDPAGQRVAREARCKVVTYGANGGSEVRGRSANVSAHGISFELAIGAETRRVNLHLTGQFNIHNALAAAACCHGIGFTMDQIVAGLEDLTTIPGRFERVSEALPYTVIVDYAHSPGAIHNVLAAGRALAPKRLIILMGCGGARDRGKRPKMGKIATEEADLTIITSDNPRSEDPLEIIKDIRRGISNGRSIIEPDRRQAIFKAVEMCEPGDMLIVAGKGHESTQQFANHTIEFDDRVVAREAIAAKGA